MPITFSCSCGKTYRATEEYAGKHIKCRECGTVISVPMNSAPEPMAAAAHAHVETTPSQNKSAAAPSTMQLPTKEDLSRLSEKALAAFAAGLLGRLSANGLYGEPVVGQCINLLQLFVAGSAVDSSDMSQVRTDAFAAEFETRDRKDRTCATNSAAYAAIQALEYVSPGGMGAKSAIDQIYDMLDYAQFCKVLDDDMIKAICDDFGILLNP